MNRSNQDSSYEKRRTFFDERASSWLDMFYRNPETGDYTLHREKFMRLFSLVDIRPGMKVLDVGCGVGVLVPYLLDRIGPEGVVYELDYAPSMIEINRKLHPDPRVRFLLADVTEVPLEEGMCDAVLCYACFPHFENKQAALKTLTKVLKNGGTLCVVHFASSAEINDHHRKAGTPVMHDCLPESQEMRGLFQEAGLTVARFLDEPGFYLARGVKGPEDRTTT